jgi:hypothetical protein
MKGFTEPVALLSTASTDFPPSGLAAFCVQPSEAVSTYSRSVLGAGSRLRLWRRNASGLMQEKFAPRERFRRLEVALKALDWRGRGRGVMARCPRSLSE